MFVPAPTFPVSAFVRICRHVVAKMVLRNLDRETKQPLRALGLWNHRARIWLTDRNAFIAPCLNRLLTCWRATCCSVSIAVPAQTMAATLHPRAQSLSHPQLFHRAFCSLVYRAVASSLQATPQQRVPEPVSTKVSAHVGIDPWRQLIHVQRARRQQMQ